MADDKKNINPQVKNLIAAIAPDGLGSHAVLTAEETAIPEQEGQANLFEID